MLGRRTKQQLSLLAIWQSLRCEEDRTGGCSRSLLFLLLLLCAYLLARRWAYTHGDCSLLFVVVRKFSGSSLGIRTGGLLVVVHLSKYTRTRTHADEGLRDLTHAARTHTRTHTRARTHARTYARTHAPRTHTHARATRTCARTYARARTIDDGRCDVRSAGVADWNTARGGNTERTLTA